MNPKTYRTKLWNYNRWTPERTRTEVPTINNKIGKSRKLCLKICRSLSWKHLSFLGETILNERSWHRENSKRHSVSIHKYKDRSIYTSVFSNIFCLFESREAAAAAWHGLEENAASAKRAESPVALQSRPEEIERVKKSWLDSLNETGCLPTSWLVGWPAFLHSL